MKSFRLTVAALALLAAGAAQATTTNWGVLTDNVPETVLGTPSAGFFVDTYDFTLASASDVSSNAGAVDLSLGVLNLLDITGGQVSLNEVGVAAPLETYAFGSSATGFTVDNLSAGNYYYTVTGFATGLAGGSYDLTAAAAVPEPETYALLAVGALGLLATKRRKAL